jgi:hypothetical protein
MAVLEPHQVNQELLLIMLVVVVVHILQVLCNKEMAVQAVVVMHQTTPMQDN